jgi:hypothetical protein
MHAHRIAGPPAGVAPPGSPDFEPQRRLLLELAVTPPPQGEGVGELARALGLPARAIEAAAEALERVGLCERHAGRLRASVALRAVEALWPLAR